MCHEMLFKAVIFLVGFGLTVAGGVSIIAYLNILAAGYSLLDFMKFIIRQPECYLLLIGIIFITIPTYANDVEK